MPEQRVVHQAIVFADVGDSIRVACSPAEPAILYRGTVRKMPNKGVSTWGDDDLEAGLLLPLKKEASYMADIVVAFVDTEQAAEATVTIEHLRNDEVIDTQVFESITSESGLTHLITIDAIVG